MSNGSIDVPNSLSASYAVTHTSAHTQDGVVDGGHVLAH